MATTRTITAPTTGAVTVDLELLGIGGHTEVLVDQDLTAAEITITTTDDTGEAADAVTSARLHWDQRGALVAHVQGQDNGGGTTVITRSGRGGVSVVQSVGTVYGSITGMVIGGDSYGDMTIVNGRVISGGGTTVVQGPAPIYIRARVPEGSAVIARTQSADLRATGPLAAVAATTQSGSVNVDTADSVHAKTMSGSIGIGHAATVQANTMSGSIQVNSLAQSGDLSTMSGSVRAHVTGTGARLEANSMSGNVTITADAHAVDSLNAHASSLSGRTSTPR
ncbi:DUF4097 family beta strand repeat-containing protein [Streptacidiphilus sp. MAP5-52]|uniref:DUF4097 family beta strand repeat-containing protein n=1 Tax=Streptacidiphilus sp. MAP5-52 TaxID=3156267 RepID=UPI00351474C7